MAAAEGARILRSKFRGCLLGALFGDALGAEFENVYEHAPVPLCEFERFSKDELSKLQIRPKKQFRFTDDSSMTMALCRSLLAEKSFNINHLARQFTETYFREPARGYGGSVRTVFYRLQTEHLRDVTLPAREQFDGSGSYGNGAAMRVSPLALFYHNDLGKLKETSQESALITHSHPQGVQGAILQAVAVCECLNTTPGSLDVRQFIDKLISIAQELELKEKKWSEDQAPVVENVEMSEENHDGRHSYVTQFQQVKQMLLESEGKPSVQHAINTLGNGIKAVEAVPAAIFAFLCKSDSCFKDALFYAISLGGDSDTIGSMAGAVAGAYWGDEQIPKEWFPFTEGVKTMTRYANELYDLRVEENSG